MIKAPDDRRLIRDAVRDTGAMVLAAQGVTRELQRKAGNEPVSEADIAADLRLRDVLTAARPDYGWLSEESADDLRRLDCRRVWIVDPIDGTRAFLRGGSDFAISVALVENGQPILAAVFAPARDEFYFAEAGGGASLNEQNIQVSNTSELADSNAIAPKGFLESSRSWRKQWPSLQVSNFNSVALRICLVATGLFDFTITARPKRDWDLAAADLILTEAGGKCLGPMGETFTYNEAETRQGPVLATNECLRDQLVEQYQSASFS